MAILSSFGHVLRLTRAAFVFAREGAFVGVDPLPLPPVLRPPLALANLIAKRDGDGLAGLSRAIARFGPSYVKLGQVLSTRPDLVCGQVALELGRPEDPVSPSGPQMAVCHCAGRAGGGLEPHHPRSDEDGMDRRGAPGRP